MDTAVLNLQDGKFNLSLIQNKTILTTRELNIFLGVSATNKTTINRLIKMGFLPYPFMIDGKSRGWSADSVLRHIERIAKKRTPKT